MEEIKISLYSVAVISISVGLLDIFSQSEKMQKYIKYVISLVVIISLLYPLQSLTGTLTGKLENMTNTSSDQAAYSNDYLKQMIENAVEENISNRLSVPQSAFDASVTLTSENEDTLVNKIKITVVDKNYFRYTERIEAYLKSNFGCEITVVQYFEE